MEFIQNSKFNLWPHESSTIILHLIIQWHKGRLEHRNWKAWIWCTRL